MKRLPALLILGALAACSGEAADEEAMPRPGAEATEPTAEEAALDGVRDAFVEHYNLHHAAMVADLYTDSAFFLSADGSVQQGKAELLADLEAAMAASPTLDLMADEHMVFGDMAVERGQYTVTMPVEGAEPTRTTGSYMTLYQREGDGWKIGGVATNFHAPQPEGFPWGEPPAETPADAGTMGELNSGFAQHLNLGHADMAADYYTEDAFAAFPDMPPVTGRAAIAAALGEMLAQGTPHLEIHDVGTIELAEGWALDGGWWQDSITTPDGDITLAGTYMALVRQQPDGSWKIHWEVVNAHPTGM